MERPPFVRIFVRIYGHFLEHIYHSVNGGLWGDPIRDRSFEGGSVGVFRKTEGESPVQQGLAADGRLVFGDAKWTDYEFTLKALKTGGG